MGSLIQPLSSQVPIVDDEGNPLPSLITMLQKLGVGTGLDGSSGTIALAAMAAKTILANKTAGSAAPTACTLSDILDFASSTRGSILYRDNTGWAALAPGTAGKVLQTNGAGADPSWVTPAAGGSIEAYNFFSSTGYALASAPTPTNPGTVISGCTVTIAASGVARTFMLNGMVTWQTGTHGMRGQVLVDGARIWPLGSNTEINPTISGDGAYMLTWAGVLLSIPGDSATHTVSLAWSAQAATTGFNVHERSMCVLKVA
jgi:hypothetical protein